MASTNRNPTNSTIMQVLLDLEAAGFKTQVGPVIASLQGDKKLLSDMETRFQQRGYNQDKLKYTQLAINQQLMELSSNALKVLDLLGMYCAQDGKVSIKLETLAKTVKLSLNTTRAAVKELFGSGLIAEVDGAKRHEAAIWQVNPQAIHTGKRRYMSSQISDYSKLISDIGEDRYLLNKQLPLVIQQDSVYRKMPDGSKLYYNRLDLVRPEDLRTPEEALADYYAQHPETAKEPTGAGTSEGSHKSKTQSQDNKGSGTGQDDQLPGQMDFSDFGI